MREICRSAFVIFTSKIGLLLRFGLLVLPMFLPIGLTGCQVNYEDRYGVISPPDRSVELTNIAWRAYGRAEPVTFRVVWLASGSPECPNNTFIGDKGICIGGQYWEAQNTVYIQYGESPMWGVLCHEVLHAVIDVEYGPVFYGDPGHGDARWNADESKRVLGDLKHCYSEVLHALNPCGRFGEPSCEQQTALPQQPSIEGDAAACPPLQNCCTKYCD